MQRRMNRNISQAHYIIVVHLRSHHELDHWRPHEERAEDADDGGRGREPGEAALPRLCHHELARGVGDEHAQVADVADLHQVAVAPPLVALLDQGEGLRGVVGVRDLDQVVCAGLK